MVAMRESMNKMWLSLYLPCLLFWSGVVSYPSGAPNRACKDMIPGHGPKPRTDPFPYAVTTSKEEYANGDVITVSINMKEQPFKGFLVQARPVKQEDSWVGTFDPIPHLARTTCDESPGNGVTHETGHFKESIQVNWTAPATSEGDIRFWVTAVHSYYNFWVQHKTSVVRHLSGETASTLPTTTECDPEESNNC